MALDGITVAVLTKQLSSALTGGRITKISQPESDELLLTIKNYDTLRLQLSANASLPLVCLTDTNKPAPLTAPNFCMLLRKHLNSARILQVVQPDLERVIQIQIEHLDELGDKKIKWLIAELMGKHSNIIFCDESMRIIDSIKHVSSFVSSVREVLPGRDYFIPQTTVKHSFLTTAPEEAICILSESTGELNRAIYTAFTGISPVIANELCHKAGIDGSLPFSALSVAERSAFLEAYADLQRVVASGAFSPCIISRDGVPVEYAAVPLTCYTDYAEYTSESIPDISMVLLQYYRKKDAAGRIRQKSAELRRIVQTAIERTAKKCDLQQKQLRDTEKKDSCRIYGELLTTYGYQAEPGSRSFTCINYYDNKEITIPLDETRSAMENAKRYFDKYAKLKRTGEALKEHLSASEAELLHLDSIRESLSYAEKEEDLAEIRRELTDCGYLKFHKDTQGGKKKKPVSGKPWHFVTAEGFEIYVGKNNYQNDELTFHVANGNDWWFHAKGVPGSHVILRTGGKEIPDHVFEIAASLAAYYSKNRDTGKVEIDYLERKNVKKPSGAKPGFVVYYTNYSMVADARIPDGLTTIAD